MFRRRRKSTSFVVTWPSARGIATKLKGETRPDTSGNHACRCPGPLHKNGDVHPSLSIRDGNNGRPLLHCFAGCEFKDIVVALERRGIVPRRGQ